MDIKAEAAMTQPPAKRANIERLAADWDGEGGYPTNEQSALYAERFAELLPATTPEPEPMQHADGNVGLYWNTGLLYADVEFHPDGRVVYFIERGTEKIKGFVSIGTPGRLVELLS